MSEPRPSQSRRPRQPGFQPRMALGMIYFLLFFFAAALLMVGPELMDVWESTPPGPEQEALAEEVAKRAFSGKFYLSFAIALVATAVGAYYQILPGINPPND